MTLPVSSSFRICTSCDGPIDIGQRFGHNPFGEVVCDDCAGPEAEEQYDDTADFTFEYDGEYVAACDEYEGWDKW